jgi:hypothetical protein
LNQIKDPGDANLFVSVIGWHPEDYRYQNLFYSISIRGQ